MQMQVLPPGVQHGEETNLGAQVLGVAGNGEQGCRDGAEQDLIDDHFVGESDRGNLFRHGEDHVEVLHRQQFGEALLDPAFACQTLALRTMPSGRSTAPNIISGKDMSEGYLCFPVTKSRPSALGTETPAILDRKSTRLNSS